MKLKAMIVLGALTLSSTAMALSPPVSDAGIDDYLRTGIKKEQSVHFYNYSTEFKNMIDFKGVSKSSMNAFFDEAADIEDEFKKSIAKWSREALSLEELYTLGIADAEDSGKLDGTEAYRYTKEAETIYDYYVSRLDEAKFNHLHQDGSLK